LEDLEICLQCGQPIDGKYFSVNHGSIYGKVHSRCIDAWDDIHAPTCAYCGEPVVEKPGKFSGKSFNVSDRSDIEKIMVHSECYDAWNDQNEPRCAQCFKAITALGFSGKFYRVNDKDKIHVECESAWENSH